MDARTTTKTKLPSRHVTEGPERAPHRSYYYAMGLTQGQIHQPFVGVATCWNEAAPCNISDLFDVAEVFKRTPYVADLKPGGRYVAKDLFEAGGVPLLMKTLLDHLWKYAQQVGSALAGAVTHPGGVAEKQCYADI